MNIDRYIFNEKEATDWKGNKEGFGWRKGNKRMMNLGLERGFRG